MTKGRPAYVTASGWSAIARNPISSRSLRTGMTAGYVVVGAGLAGLAVARALAERFPNERIVLLDAGLPGANSSGRNSGFLIDLPYAKISAGDVAREAWQTRLLGFGKRTLEHIVDTQRIECDWREVGHYKAATTPEGQRKLTALSATLEAHGVEHRTLSPQQIAAELGTSHYREAIWLRNCTLVQPAELVHGLISSLPANVEVCFDAPVTKLRREGTWTLEVAGFQIRSPQVVLCVNTALPGFGYAKYRQIAVYTYAGLTRRLSDAEFAQLGTPPDWGVTPVERMEATSRKVNGNRLLLRCGFSYETEMEPAKVRAMLQAAARSRYPELEPDPFEYVWGGAVSITRNDAPILRRYADGLYALSGCNASGILKMTALGQLLADLMSERESALLSETLRFCNPTFIPPEPIRRIAVNLNLKRFKRELRSTELNTSSNRLHLVKSNIANPPSIPISNALIANDVIYTVQVPRDPQTFVTSGEGDIEVQAARVFDQLKHVLECAGSNLAHVAQMTVYLVDKADAPGMNRVYARYFTAPPYPNRATVIVKELIGENCLIEVVVHAIKA